MPPEEPTPPPLKPAITTGDIPESALPPDAKALTPEEQMARFAEELKNSDWGHQPN